MVYILVKYIYSLDILWNPFEGFFSNHLWQYQKNNKKRENLIFNEPIKQLCYQSDFLTTNNRNQFLQI